MRICLRLLSAALLCLLAALPALAQPKAGGTMPALTLPGLSDPADVTYLGLPGPGPFGLKDVDAPFILVEFIGVYCPQCHRQVSIFNQLFTHLARAGLDGKIKMLALAGKGTAEEVAYLRQKGGYLYPVVPDPDGAIFKALDEPKTPYTMIVARDGAVRYAHLGVLYDEDDVFDAIRKIVE